MFLITWTVWSFPQGQGLHECTGNWLMLCNLEAVHYLHPMRTHRPQHPRPAWPAPHRSSLRSRQSTRLQAVHEHADVVVVGAGIIGLSVALELLEQSRDVSVAVTDKVRLLKRFLPTFSVAGSPLIPPCTCVRHAPLFAVGQHIRFLQLTEGSHARGSPESRSQAASCVPRSDMRLILSVRSAR